MDQVATSKSDVPWDRVTEVFQRPDGLYQGKWKVHETLPTEYTVIFRRDNIVVNTAQGPGVFTRTRLLEGPEQLETELTNWTRPQTNQAKRNKAEPMKIKGDPRFRFHDKEDQLILSLVETQGKNFELIAREINKILPAGRKPRHRNSVRRRYYKLTGSAPGPSATCTSCTATTDGASSSLAPSSAQDTPTADQQGNPSSSESED